MFYQILLKTCIHGLDKGLKSVFSHPVAIFIPNVALLRVVIKLTPWSRKSIFLFSLSTIHPGSDSTQSFLSLRYFVLPFHFTEFSQKLSLNFKSGLILHWALSVEHCELFWYSLIFSLMSYLLDVIFFMTSFSSFLFSYAVVIEQFSLKKTINMTAAVLNSLHPLFYIRN